jgi:hypothetical protein
MEPELKMTSPISVKAPKYIEENMNIEAEDLYLKYQHPKSTKNLDQ